MQSPVNNSTKLFNLGLVLGTLNINEYQVSKKQQEKKINKMVRSDNLNNELLNEEYLQTTEYMLTSILLFPQIFRGSL